jgi:Arc/MetJ-type ribon-helix-helix transcriptional regulator
MTYCHTMPRDKIAITLDRQLLRRVDRLVRARGFPSRSHAIAQAVAEKLERLDRTRLARECAKLDPRAEAALADEGLSTDLRAWPAY